MNQSLVDYTTHDVIIEYVKSECGSPGHTDTLARCSCGWEKRLNHGTGDVTKDILNHRVCVIEEALGIEFSIEWGK